MIAFACGRYLLWIIAIFAAVIVLDLAVQYLFQATLPTSVSYVSLILPPFLVGQAWVRKFGALPTKSEAWACGALFTLIQAGIGVLVAVLIAYFEPAVFSSMASLGSGFWAVVSLLFLAVSLVISRFMFSSAAKQIAKQGLITNADKEVL
ncbi:MAG: ABZJ_00895 family protein [Pseudomonadota bacterium]